MKTSIESRCSASRQSLLTDGALGLLSKARAQKLARHLEQCIPCRAELARRRDVIRRLENVPRLTARDPDLLTQAIMNRVSALQRSRRHHVLSLLTTPAWRAAALMLLAASLAVWIWNTLPRSGADGIASVPEKRARTVSDSVLLAAHWLVSAQEADGRWTSRRWQAHPSIETALNALAVLSLLEAHRLDPETDMNMAIRRALGHLSARIDDTGRFGPPIPAAHYNHAPATLALMQGRAIAPEAVSDAIIDQALAWITRTQNPDGGWGYLDDPDQRSNLGITYWNLHVLHTAYLHDHTRVEHDIRRAVRWVQANRAENQGFAYHRSPAAQPPGAGASAAMDAMGLLCLRVPGQDFAPRHQPAVDRLLSHTRGAATDRDYYRDYLLTAALRDIGANETATAMMTIRSRVRRRQVVQGPLAGSWNPDDRWSAAGGRLYATAMAVLSQQP